MVKNLNIYVKSLRRTVEWVGALAASTIGQCAAAHLNCPRSLWLSVSALWSLRHSVFCKRTEWFRRMKRCKRCPIYDHKTNRCYNPSKTVVVDGVTRPLGCGCYMPVKARLSDAECWGAGFGMDQWS